jgi:hypothetical protein
MSIWFGRIAFPAINSSQLYGSHGMLIRYDVWKAVAIGNSQIDWKKGDVLYLEGKEEEEFAAIPMLSNELRVLVLSSAIDHAITLADGYP